MNYSDSDKHEKKSKKSSKRQLHEESDVTSPAKVGKKIKLEVAPEGTNGPVQNNFSYKKQALPNWLEITDSEDESQMPTEKPKKKKKESLKKMKIKQEEPEISSQEESTFNIDESEARPSPKKKKRTKREEQEITVGPSDNTDEDAFVSKSPQKTWKKNKSPQKVKKEPKEMETVEKQQYYDEGVDSKKNQESVKSSKLKKGKKQKNSAPPVENLYRVDDKFFSESDNHPEDTLNSSQSKSPSPKKTKKASNQAAAVLQEQTPNEDDEERPESSEGKAKKSSKKSIKCEPTSSTFMHKKTGQDEEVDETPARTPKKLAKKITKNSTMDFSEDSDDDKFGQQSRQTSPIKRGRKAAEASFENVAFNADDDDDNDEDDADPVTKPKWKQPKKRTTILNADALDVGEEYQLKTKREKMCKNCTEVVKLKSKVTVRDMGCQTRESALLNHLIKTPLAQPRIKKVEPRSVEERVIVPEQRSSDDEFIEDTVKPPTLTQDQIKYLRSLEITFKHPPLPQHQIGNLAGTRTLTSEEQREFEKYATLKKGAFGPWEDETIVENWTKFCKRHNWNPNLTFPFTHFRFNGAFYLPQSEQRQKFVQFLAQGLPNRSLYSVIMRFRKIYGTHKSDRYTCAEDDMIWSTMHPRGNPDRSDKNQKPKKDDDGKQGKRPRVFADLGRKLNRTPYSVWRRYTLLSQKRKLSKTVL